MYKFNRLNSIADKQQKLEVHMMLLLYTQSLLYMTIMKFYLLLGSAKHKQSLMRKKNLMGKKNAECQWMAIIYGALGSELMRGHYKGNHGLQFGAVRMTL